MKQPLIARCDQTDLSSVLTCMQSDLSSQPRLGSRLLFRDNFARRQATGLRGSGSDRSGSDSRGTAGRRRASAAAEEEEEEEEEDDGSQV